MASAQISLNQATEYVLGLMFGRSPRTRQAYASDLTQFKLYLVRFRRHGLVDPEDLAVVFEDELRRAGGKLLDTPRYERHHQTELRSRSLLEQIDWDLARLTHHDVLAYFGYLSDGGVARATLNRRLAALRTFFKLLIKDGHPKLKPILEHLLELETSRERKLPIALERDEALAFLGAISSLRDRAIVLVMLYMGLRISEVVKLNVEDITEHTTSLTFSGKGSKERFVPVHPAVAQAVTMYKETERPDVVADDGGQPLFVSRVRRRLSPGAIRSLIKRYATRTERLDARKRGRLSPHKLRHTFATLLLEGDVDIRYIQELLGHEQLATTEIYTSVRKRDLERAISRHPLGEI